MAFSPLPCNRATALALFFGSLLTSGLVTSASAEVLNKAYVASSTGNFVDVVDLETTTPEISKLPMGWHPTTAAFNPNGSQVFILNQHDKRITVLDPVTDRVSGSIVVGHIPTHVAFDAAGEFAYVANFGDSTVSVIDARTLQEVRVIAIPGSPETVLVNGASLYVALPQDNKVLMVDLKTDSVIDDFVVGTQPSSLVMNVAGDTIFVPNRGSSNLSVIDVKSGEVQTIPVGNQPFSAEVTLDGSRVYVANNGGNSISVINTHTLAVITTITGVSAPLFIGISADGEEVYTVGRSNVLSVVSTASNTMTRTLNLAPHSPIQPRVLRNFMAPVAQSAAIPDSAPEALNVQLSGVAEVGQTLTAD